MSVPFFSEGTTPRRQDTTWKITVKWLGAVQDQVAVAFPVNDPNRWDTTWVLEEKLNAALAGVPWKTGPDG